MRRRTTITISALLIAACAPQIVPQTSYNRATDFSAMHSFAWKESDVVVAGAYDPVVSGRVEAIVRGTVVEDLVKKGYTPSTEADADMLVSYSIIVMNEEQSPNQETRRSVLVVDSSTNIGDAARVIRPGTSEGQLDQPRSYRHGTLIVFIMSNDGKIIWQGTVEGSAISPREALAKSRKAVQALMAEFPPQPQSRQ